MEVTSSNPGKGIPIILFILKSSVLMIIIIIITGTYGSDHNSFCGWMRKAGVNCLNDTEVIFQSLKVELRDRYNGSFTNQRYSNPFCELAS